ncbi:hypothetical protein ACFWE5_03905 [Cellulosimicrobium funkei]|uniref:hypothetical protein n=1 Tax=Cellulosimicrobium funkei TaxID=264251 RepID=UPI0036630DB5
MTGLEFVDSTIGHVLSWPVIVLVALLVFRKPIRKRIKAIRRAKVGAAEVEFTEKLRDTEENVEQVKSDPAAGPGDESDSEEREDRARQAEERIREAEENPSASVLLAWADFEREQRRVAHSLGISGRMDARTLEKELRKRGVGNDQYAEAVMDLRKMRNLVAHGEYEPSPGEAANYVQLSLELCRFLRAWQIHRPPTEPDGGADG